MWIFCVDWQTSVCNFTPACMRMVTILCGPLCSTAGPSSAPPADMFANLPGYENVKYGKVKHYFVMSCSSGSGCCRQCPCSDIIPALACFFLCVCQGLHMHPLLRPMSRHPRSSTQRKYSSSKFCTGQNKCSFVWQSQGALDTLRWSGRHRGNTYLMSLLLVSVRRMDV